MTDNQSTGQPDDYPPMIPGADGRYSPVPEPRFQASEEITGGEHNPFEFNYDTKTFLIDNDEDKALIIAFVDSCEDKSPHALGTAIQEEAVRRGALGTWTDDTEDIGRAAFQLWNEK